MVLIGSLMASCTSTDSSDSSQSTNEADTAQKNFRESVTAPVPSTIVTLFEDQFEQSFVGCEEWEFCNAIQFNYPVGTTTFKPLKIKYSVIGDYIDFATPSEELDEGYILHYIVEKLDSHYYFSYAITAGRIDNGQVSAVPMVGINYGYSIARADYDSCYIKPLGEAEFNNLTKSYCNVISYDDYPYGYYDIVSDGYLPRSCFYSEADLSSFFAQNDAVPENNRYLYFKHGATAIDIQEDIVYGQTPILMWGTKQNPSTIDDVSIPGSPFKNKALDIGHLCPPNCNAPTTPCH